MATTGYRRARRAVLCGVAVAAVVSLGLGQVAERVVRLRDPLYGDKAVKLAARRTDRPLVLMLGSSRTGLAFHGRLLEQLQPVAAFNYGVPATGPVTHRVYLDRLHTSGVRPAVLLVEVMPAMLSDTGGPPWEANWLFADRLTGPERETVLRYGFPADLVNRRWRQSVLLPAYALRFQLMGRISPSWLPWQLRFDWSKGADAWGWGSLVNQTPTAAERERSWKQAEREYAGPLNDYRPGGPAVTALRELVEAGQAHGAAVRLVLMPESSQFRGLYGPGADDRLLAVLKTVPAPLTDARAWLPDEAFNDGHHMLVGGAERFTERLGREVVR